MEITGTNGPDTLAGTAGDDVINGLGGFDTINGDAGNDVIDGGADGDSIQGGAGSDTVDGGDGNDFISDYQDGSDTLRGGAGADNITFSHYGPSTGVETVLIDGGLDDDSVFFASTVGGTASINLGDGADRLLLNSVVAAAVTATLGAGRDTVTLQRFSSVASAPTIADFATGDDGDVLDISEYLTSTLINWDGSNPFGSGGFSRLQQSGTSTLLQVDRDGAAGTMHGFTTLFTFQNTDAGRFTTANLGGYAPDGSPVQGRTITGTATSDTLTGTVGDDVISGLGGFDMIDGKAGDDVIDGGAESDNIQAGFGDDIVDGGDGNDSINDVGGSDTLRGGAGNDFINVFHSPSGPVIPTETISVDGGTGDDQVGYYVFTLGTGTIDLGDGADRLALGNGPGAVRATLGAGRDALELSGFANGGQAPVIIDFTGGATGDNVLLTTGFSFNFQGWDGTSNPFGAAG